MTKLLWTKQAAYFIVEAKIGNAWVPVGQRNTMPEGQGLAKATLQEPAVTAVRLLEHQITHRNFQIFQEAARTELRLPPKIMPTGETTECPRCKFQAQVTTDGKNEWVFCARCKSALPA